MYGGRPCHYEKYSNNAAASHAHESELWLAFYILWLVSHKTRFFERLGVGCRSPPRFALTHWPERNERSLSMSGKKITYNPPATKPKRPIAERVVSERGRKELPPGTKGGENLKPDRHYEHKQHAFDSYYKKVLKYEAYNAIVRSAAARSVRHCSANCRRRNWPSLRFMTATPGNTRPSPWEAL